ncbi:cytochrome B [Rhodobacteraceae bacterium]|nr:cytochrome B [Paracoccaceae bacterium]
MLSNTNHSYGSLARGLHWAIALLIVTAIALGLYGESLPRNAQTTATLQTVFSLHKTIGVSVLVLAVIRILWRLGQTKPTPLHPERRAETFVAEAMHYALYGAMIVMPVSGWISHAAHDGFAPILYPIGQNLPFVPKSEAVAGAAESVHKMSASVLYIALGLHVLGAFKHMVIDRDGTLGRMVSGRAAGAGEAAGHAHGGAALLALSVWAGVILAGLLGFADSTNTRQAATTPGPAPQGQAQASAGNWVVQNGTLEFSVIQMGSPVSGSFGAWQAQITYDKETGTGDVSVDIDTTSLSLAAVTDQAKGPEFFDTDTYKTARFTAPITRVGNGPEHTAEGQLTMIGATAPVTLDFTLDIDGDTAHMQGKATLDRRDWDMGATYEDEGTVGYPVSVTVDLTAQAQD